MKVEVNAIRMIQPMGIEWHRFVKPEGNLHHAVNKFQRGAATASQVQEVPAPTRAVWVT